eukprot:RCo033808
MSARELGPGDPNKYRFQKLIGNGSFGQVFLVQADGADPERPDYFVVKKIHIAGLSEKECKDAANEVAILKLLDHPNIIKYVDRFITNDGFLNIVMEYCEGGDLGGLIARAQESGQTFPEERVVVLAFEMLQALKYVHSVKILHRDIKPGNILLTADHQIKLADFGISKRLVDTVHAQSVVGTPYYLAPEVCEGKPYDYAGDVWSMGCVIYELAALRRAFEASNLLAVVRAITSATYPALPSSFSASFAGMIRRMLAPKAAQRPSVHCLLEEYFILPVPVTEGAPVVVQLAPTPSV